MKKLRYIALLLIAGLLLLQIPAFAAGTGSLKAAQVTGKPGEEVRVALTLETNPGLIAARFGVQYDPAVVALVRAENGTVFADDLALFGKVTTANPYYLLWEDALGAANNTKTGTLAVLVFRILDTAKGSSDVRILVDQGSVFNFNLEEVPLKATDGKITVKGAPVATTTAPGSTQNDTTATSHDGGLSVVPKESEIPITGGLTDADKTTVDTPDGTQAADGQSADGQPTGTQEEPTQIAPESADAQARTADDSTQTEKSAKKDWRIYAIIGAVVLLLAVVIVLLSISKKKTTERGKTK